jgi:hypothetical protein
VLQAERAELDQQVQMAIQDPQALLALLDLRVRKVLQVALARLDLLEAKVTQGQQVQLERQDPKVLLAQQVLLEAQGLLDPQGQLE